MYYTESIFNVREPELENYFDICQMVIKPYKNLKEVPVCRSLMFVFKGWGGSLFVNTDHSEIFLWIFLN